MKTLGWLLLGGVGIYVLDQMGVFSSFLGTSATVPVGTGTPVNTGGGTSTTPQGSDQTQVGTGSLTALQNQVMGYVVQDPNFQNVAGQWVGSGFHWQTTLNAVLPGAPVPNVDLNQNYTQAQYWGLVTPLLGAAGFSGLGMIAHHVNPYILGPRVSMTKKFGAGLAPTGMETYVVAKGQA